MTPHTNGHGGASAPPLVAIPCHGRDLAEIGLPACYLMGQGYVNALARAGAAALPVPLYHDETLLRAIYDAADGVFLAGGRDVDPALYHNAPHELLGPLEPERDRVEMLFLSWALADKKPILAVCRGAQALNVAAGGTLFQDIGAQVPGALDHFAGELVPRETLTHSVTVLPDTRLRALMGTDASMVNSQHHQAVDQLADGFRVTALAPDGVVEAIEAVNGQFAVGVQWHPEALVASLPPMQHLFEGFVDELNRHRELKTGG